MKYGELYGYPGLPERQTSGSSSKLSLKLQEAKMAELKLSYFQAHHEKAGVFGKKKVILGENRRQQEKSKHELD